MSSTQFRQGYNENKPTSRVLKPPGGGSSNIFGPPTEPSSAPQSRVNRTQSNIFFKEPENNPAPKSSTKTDTHSNVFGVAKPEVKDLTPSSTLKGQGSDHNPITGLPSGNNSDAIAETVTKGSLGEPIAKKEANETSLPPTSQPDIPRIRIPTPSTRVSQPPGGHCHRLW